MHRWIFGAVVTAVGLSLLFIGINAHAAQTAVQPANGGTGLNTLPSYGNVLVGNSNGGYMLVATSSLGITGAANFTLTTTGSSGASTYSGGVLNIPIYTGGGATFGYPFPGNATTTNITFSNGITGNISGNAGTVTNGVYTTTFGGLFDNRLSATTSLPNIITLSGLSLPYSQLTGTPRIASTTLLGDTNTFSGTDTFSNPITGSITGNSGTATKLQNVRTINGISFDGTGNITINAASSTLLGDTNTFSGNNTFTQTVTGSVSGNAGTATVLQNARTINGVSFNGSANIVVASTTLLGDVNNWSALNKFSTLTATNATTSGSLYVTGPFASTTNLFANGLTSCNGGTNALTWSGGTFGCNVISSGSSAQDPFPNHATSTTLGFQNGLISNASSTFSGNVFFSNRGTPAGSLAAFDPQGQLIPTTTSSGGVASVSGTYPVQSTGGTNPSISLAFGTTTANTWGAANTFNGATTTFAQLSPILGDAAPTNLSNFLNITASRSYAPSVTTGAMVRFDNGSTNAGPALGLKTDFASGATGRLFTVNCTSASFDQDCQHIDYAGVGDALSITNTSTGASSNAISIVGQGDHTLRAAYTGVQGNGAGIFTSTATTTVLNVVGPTTGQGVLKITHTGTSTDSNAAGLSIDAATSTVNGQGPTAAAELFLNSTGSTTGNIITGRNNNKDYFDVDSTGNITAGSLSYLGVSDGCATFSSNRLNSTGTACGSGSSGQPPFPNNATSTALGFLSGLFTNGSTTVTSVGSGLVGANNGLLYGVSTTSLSASITGSAASVTNALTINSSGSGASSGSTYNGSSAVTLSYNSIGAAPSTRNINTTWPLQGGGDLSADRTLTFGGLSTSTGLTANSIPLITGVNTFGNSSLSQSAGTTFINGTTPIIDGGGNWLSNVIQAGSQGLIIQPTATSSSVLGNLVQAGGITQVTASQTIVPATFCGTGEVVAASTTAADVTLTLPSRSWIQSFANANPTGPCSPTAWPSSFAQQTIFNNSSHFLTETATDTAGYVFEYAPGTPTKLGPGQTWLVTGQLSNEYNYPQGFGGSNSTIRVGVSLLSTGPNAYFGTTTSVAGAGVSIGTTTIRSAAAGFYTASSTCTGTCTATWQTEGSQKTGSNIIKYLLNQSLTLTLNATSSQPVPGPLDLRFCQDAVGSHPVTLVGGLINYTSLVTQSGGTLGMATAANTCEDFGMLWEPSIGANGKYIMEASSSPYSNQ